MHFLSLRLYAIMCQLFKLIIYILGRLPMNIQALMQQAQAMQKQVEKMLKLPKQVLQPRKCKAKQAMAWSKLP